MRKRTAAAHSLYFTGTVIVLTLLTVTGCNTALIAPAPTATDTPSPAIAWPSPTATPTLTPAPTPPPLPPTTATPFPIYTGPLSTSDQATFVSETIPDLTQFAPGEAFTKTWTLRNTGESTWTTDYALVRGISTPAGAHWGTPHRIPLTHPVAPGEEATFSVSLTAPQAVGIYVLYWALVNAHGEIVPVDDGRQIWVAIQVCAAELPCTAQDIPPTSPEQVQATAEVAGVSAELLEFTANAQQAVAKICMTCPNKYYLIQQPVFLQLDDLRIASSAGSTLGLATSPTLCYVFAFPVTEEQIAQASRVAILIQQVRMSHIPNPEERCQIVHDQLVGQYPGLDFTCRFTTEGYFTDLQPPRGMSADDARQMILDAIEGAINGPWALRVR